VARVGVRLVWGRECFLMRTACRRAGYFTGTVTAYLERGSGI